MGLPYTAHNNNKRERMRMKTIQGGENNAILKHTFSNERKKRRNSRGENGEAINFHGRKNVKFLASTTKEFLSLKRTFLVVMLTRYVKIFCVKDGS